MALATILNGICRKVCPFVHPFVWVIALFVLVGGYGEIKSLCTQRALHRVGGVLFISILFHAHPLLPDSGQEQRINRTHFAVHALASHDV